MADTKITGLLSPQVTTNPATDVLPIVNIADTLMASSGSTRKITVNQLLGAGGTATLASATITGDLTVNTNVLKVDSTNDRVGIGTATPASLFNVYRSTVGEVARFVGSTDSLGELTLTSSDNVGSGRTWTWNGASAYAQHIWQINSSTAMTLNSSGLGVGGSPANGKFIVGADATTDGNGSWNSTFRNTVGAATTAPKTGIAFSAYWNGTSNFANFSGITGGKENTTDANTAGLLTFWTSPNGGSPTTRMTIDSSGNVGIGVTPSTAWNTGGNLQVGTLGALYHNQTLGATDLTYNSIRTGTDTYQYLNGSSLQASRFQQRDGTFRFFNAPAGTSPNAITFTQAMTLDASGNLLVGVTSAGGNRLNVQTASGDCTVLIKSTAASTNAALTIDYVNTYGNINFSKSGTSKWSIGILNDSASTPTFKVFNDAAAGVYVTYGATSWTGTSDERLKDIIEPISNAVAKVGKLRSVIGKFKADETNTRRSFLLAQDVQAVLPEAVDASNPDRLGVAYTDVIPLLVAAIKELTARVQTLEAK